MHPRKPYIDRHGSVQVPIKHPIEIDQDRAPTFRTELVRHPLAPEAVLLQRVEALVEDDLVMLGVQVDVPILRADGAVAFS